ncbi:MAG: DUF21 domain-containing protein [Planctomycetes bacterium]|nr:DUF21 domain-containing protein [Planctomycetota bacterium]
MNAAFLHIPVTAILLIIPCLMVLSAFWSATEISMFSFRKTKLSLLVKQGNKRALLIERIMKRPENLLSAILVGNNITNTAISVLITALAIAYLGEEGVLVAMVVATFLLIAFGEILPKVLASQYWEFTAYNVARPIGVAIKLFGPLNFLFSLLTRLVAGIFGIKIEYRKPFITKEELKHIVHISQESGHLHEHETALLQNVFKFTDSLVHDVMVPRDKIMAVDANMPSDQILKMITEKHFTRLPVYEGTIDNIIGVLHTKEYFNVMCYENVFVLQDLLREPYFVAEDMKISEVLRDLQKNRVHLAVVNDKNGSVAGMITIENIIEYRRC